MAKLECTLQGNFQGILAVIEHEILGGSISASLEDATNWQSGGVQCAVRVFERYSWIGGNRVSLTVVLLDDGDSVRISAIASGGSQGVFFKVNTFGEQAFLNKLNDVLAPYYPSAKR